SLDQQEEYRIYSHSFVNNMSLAHTDDTGVYSFSILNEYGNEININDFELIYYPLSDIYSVRYKGESSLPKKLNIKWIVTRDAKMQVTVDSEKIQPIITSEEKALEIISRVHSMYGEITLSEFQRKI